MVLTRDFKDTIKDHVARDPAFREELLKEGMECLLTGDIDTGKAVLRDFINATIGFDALGTATERSREALCGCWGQRETLRPVIFLRSLPVFKNTKTDDLVGGDGAARAPAFCAHAAASLKGSQAPA